MGLHKVELSNTENRFNDFVLVEAVSPVEAAIQFKGKRHVVSSIESKGTLLEDAIDEALSLFNGYWAWDYEMCDRTADKYNFDRKEFTTAVYKSIR